MNEHDELDPLVRQYLDALRKIGALFIEAADNFQNDRSEPDDVVEVYEVKRELPGSEKES